MAQNGNQGTIQAYSLFLSCHGNRSYWGTFDPLFSDAWYMGAKSEITGFTGRKTGLFIPFGWRKSDLVGWSMQMGKKGCFSDLVFRMMQGNTFGQ